VHTLKGNARFFGLTRLAALCHELEDAMQERGENTLTTQERGELGASWAALAQRIEPIIHGATAFVEISEEEYGRLLDALVERAPLERVEELVRGLRHEPTEWRLTRARDTLLAICAKLGKTAPKVALDHGDLRLPPGRWAPFWSVVPHLINNIADHGIETDDERRESGKPVPAEVRMRTRLEGGEFIVELSDDGRGIDWERVRKRADERSLPSQSQRDLEQALFSEGLSLKEKVTDVSGRGVGLAAVRTVVTAMSGRIELDSKLGRGTTFCFRFPAGDAAGARKGPAIKRTPPLAS
jgi:two-component system chemotaxis sensor kinase CheA